MGRKHFFYTLAVVLVGIGFAIFQTPDSKFRIIACDVGQGDAILVTYKNIQILTDGGPNNDVLNCLAKHVPFYDREIELVVLTHPQKDHYQGLIEVFRRYKVDNYLYNKIDSGSQGYEVLEKEVGRGGAKTLSLVEGQVIRVGLISLDILWPPKDFTDTNLNNVGYVTLVKYGDFEALLTADVENEISDRLSLNPKIRSLDYLKVNHHGSRNGLSENLLKEIMPKIAIISLGKNNSYGHPHQEILQMLSKYKSQILRTDEMGDVVVETDGKTFRLD